MSETLTGFASDVVGPFRVLWNRPDQGPTGNVDVDVLRVLVVSKEGLRVLPAVETADTTEWCWDDGLEGLALSIAPVRTLDVCGLYLAAVVDDGAGGVYE